MARRPFLAHPYHRVWPKLVISVPQSPSTAQRFVSTSRSFTACLHQLLSGQCPPAALLRLVSTNRSAACLTSLAACLTGVAATGSCSCDGSGLVLCSLVLMLTSPLPSSRLMPEVVLFWPPIPLNLSPGRLPSTSRLGSDRPVVGCALLRAGLYAIGYSVHASFHLSPSPYGASQEGVCLGKRRSADIWVWVGGGTAPLFVSCSLFDFCLRHLCLLGIEV